MLQEITSDHGFVVFREGDKMIFQMACCVLTQDEASGFCKLAANDAGQPGVSPLALLHRILADFVEGVEEDGGRPSLRMIRSRGAL